MRVFAAVRTDAGRVKKPRRLPESHVLYFKAKTIPTDGKLMPVRNWTLRWCDSRNICPRSVKVVCPQRQMVRQPLPYGAPSVFWASTDPRIGCQRAH